MYNDFTKDLHMLFPRFQNIYSENEFWFPGSSKNFCNLFSFSCEVFVLHGYDEIHWVAKSCTTTAYRWLFGDSQPSPMTVWSVFVKPPTFSARNTTSPVPCARKPIPNWFLGARSSNSNQGIWIWCDNSSGRFFGFCVFFFFFEIFLSLSFSFFHLFFFLFFSGSLDLPFSLSFSLYFSFSSLSSLSSLSSQGCIILRTFSWV